MSDVKLRKMLEQQQQMLDLLQSMNASLQTTNASLQSVIEQKDAEIERLNLIIRNFQKALFGPKSEKTLAVLGGQLSLFPQAVAPETKELPTNKAQTIAAHTRRPKRSQDEIYKDLPAVKRILDIQPEERIGKDGRPLVKIGEEFLRSEINFKPSEITRTDIYRVKYADRSEEMETGQTIIVSPIVPKPLIEHSFVSPSLASAIICFKYVNALPLYRIEQMFKQKRCPLTRATMANWMIQISQIYLNKLCQRFKAILLMQSVIHADETPLRVLKEPGRKPTQKSYLWCYTTAKRCSIQIRLFDYQPSRAGSCPETFLNGYHGIVISDGYQVYIALENVTNACCWAHARRYWINAMPKGVPTDNCAQTIGLDFCNKLFELERKFESDSNEDRYTKRNAPYNSAQPDEKSSAVVLNEYWNWLDSLGAVSGALKKAVDYSRNRRKELEVFLKHGEIEISNNQAENAIRPVVVGRKNWLFSDTPEGAEASATIYSIVETAKANQLNIEEWLNYVLEELPDRFAYDPNADIDDLLPWADKMQKRFRMT